MRKSTEFVYRGIKKRNENQLHLFYQGFKMRKISCFNVI